MYETLRKDYLSSYSIMMIANCMVSMKLQAMVSSVLNQMHGQMVATERQAIPPRYDPLIMYL
jgi:hypothetical protein